MDPRERQRLRDEARGLEASMSVGKGGLGEGVVAEIRRQLEAHGLVKLRLLEAARQDEDRHAMAERLAQACGAELVEVRGFTVVLYRPKKGRAGTGAARSAGS